MAETGIVKKNKAGGLAKKGQWSDGMRQYAKKAAAQEQLSGNFISFKGGRIKVAGNDIGTKMNVIVLGAVYENALYGAYDPDDVKPPLCYGFSEERGELCPHAQVKKPFTVLLPNDGGEFEEQTLEPESCEGCPANAYGTARKQNGDPGKGKACKNIKRLAVISANAEEITPALIKTSEVFYAKLPVTSVNAWSQYVKGVEATYGLPYFGMVTEIAASADEDVQIAVAFREVGPLDGALEEALVARHEDLMKGGLIAAYPERTNDAQKKGKGKPAAKPTTTKRKKF